VTISTVCFKPCVLITQCTGALRMILRTSCTGWRNKNLLGRSAKVKIGFVRDTRIANIVLCNTGGVILL